MLPPRVVAIHQPNFLPWLGLFDKVARADVFVLLDSVQFPKSGAGTWINRVKLLMAGEAKWLTVPVDRAYHGTRLVREMRISNVIPWREKMLEAIRHNYVRTKWFSQVFPLVESVIGQETNLLSAFNEQGIRELTAALDLPHGEFVRSSDLSVSGEATDLLASVTKAVDGTTYLSGDGSGDYLEEQTFADAGLGLVYQNFVHPVYLQVGTEEFIPGLSVIDALMSCGFAGVRSLLLGRGAD
jgi:hypothetical protein